MWVLKEQGAAFDHHEGPVSEAGLRVDGGEPGLQEQAFYGCEDCLTFNFPSAADGHARRARREQGEGFRIIATGNLMPDQAWRSSVAFQRSISTMSWSAVMARRLGVTRRMWHPISSIPNRVGTFIWDKRHRHRVKIQSLTAAEAFEALQESTSAVPSAPLRNGGPPAFDAASASNGRPFLTAQQTPVSSMKSARPG